MSGDSISGQVIGPDGTPVQGAVVKIVQQDPPPAETKVARQTTNSQGEYFFDETDVRGKGPWHVTARYEDNGQLYHDFSKPYIDADLLEEQAEAVNVDLLLDVSLTEDASTAIPDSGADHQWNYIEGSGTSIADANGSLDISYNAIQWNSGSGANGVHGVLDGDDDYGDFGSASQSELSHFLENGVGTLFAWVRCDNTNGIQILYLSNEIATSNRSFSFYVDWDDPDIRWVAGDGSSNMWDVNPTGTTPNQGDWVAFAATANGSTAKIYLAEPTGYDVTEIGSGSISNGSSGDLSDNVLFGRDPTDSSRYWDGAVDISFVDSSGWTESELQSFVDDSKGLYE